jgi:hypothetical protein
MSTELLSRMARGEQIREVRVTVGTGGFEYTVA